MSGFSPAWLALREPADIAARNTHILNACAQAFKDHAHISVCDIGAGTGASVRAFAGMLPSRQRWTLVDHDADNLAAAVAALTQWADTASSLNGGVELRRGEQHIQIFTCRHDLAADPACWPEGTDLVTASALFDLTSAPWMDRFAAALRSHRLPLLATLTVDGDLRAEPRHPLDQSVTSAFSLHQQCDKGFGPAAGGSSAAHLERAFKDNGYTLEAGDSPWIIPQTSPELLHAVLDGIAAAAAETGTMTKADAERWLKERQAGTRQLIVGHRDLFARI